MTGHTDPAADPTRLTDDQREALAERVATELFQYTPEHIATLREINPSWRPLEGAYRRIFDLTLGFLADRAAATPADALLAVAWAQGRESIAVDMTRPLNADGTRPATANPYLRKPEETPDA